MNYLALERKISASTQNQAFNALLFLFRYVLKRDFKNLEDTIGAKVPKRLPVVLSRNEVERLFFNLSGLHLLISQLIYGSGLRITECLTLRIKDIDFDGDTITVRAGNIQMLLPNGDGIGY